MLFSAALPKVDCGEKLRRSGPSLRTKIKPISHGASRIRVANRVGVPAASASAVWSEISVNYTVGRIVWV
jgi:hypothetical protein